MADGVEFPLCSSKKLQLEAVPGADMYTVSGVLTVPECQAFIDAAESLGFQHQGSGGPAAGEAFRDNQRVSVQDADLATCLWRHTGLAAACQHLRLDGARPCGLNSNIRFYRYDPGQRFGRHIDDSVELGDGQVTGYTLLIYLSGGTKQPSAAGEPSAATGSRGNAVKKASASSKCGGKRGRQGREEAAAAVLPRQQQAAPVKEAVQDLVGGETVFYGARGRCVASITPAPGLALLHLHGEERCLEHEARAVLAGSKYILRSDVVFQV